MARAMHRIVGRDDVKHSDGATVLPAAAEAERNALDQVRELLFGETRRSSDQRHDDLNAHLEAIADEFRARFDKLEASVEALARDTEQRRLGAIETIGSAIADLGAHIRKLGTPRSGS
jgi:predicted phage gp36 major capsid-like protein